MQLPTIPENELQRLATLRALNVLDTDAEERFDRITRLTRRIFSLPICVVTLVDAERQWFKSRQGLEVTETPREISFCGHAINQDDIFIVNDALKDPRFSDNPLVTEQPHIRFYAGYPLTIYGPIRFARHSIAILRRVHCTHISGLLLRGSSGPDGYLLLLSLSSLRLRNEPMAS